MTNFFVKKQLLLFKEYLKVFRLDGIEQSYLNNDESPLDYFYIKHGFITEWTIDNSDLTVTLPTVDLVTFPEGVYDCEVDWGDGTVSTITSYNDLNRIHTYAQEGTYWIEIKGTFSAWSMESFSQVNKNKLRKVIFWGGKPFNGFNYLENAFNGCSNFSDLGTFYIQTYNNGCNSFKNFCSNTKIRNIKYPIFMKHINATSFEESFSNNLLIEGVCNDLFRYNTEVVTFKSVFDNDLFLNQIPSELFLYNKKVNDFSYSFFNCERLYINSNLFYNEDEKDTRFNEITDINFSYCFSKNNYYLYKQSTAPDLWTCTFYGTVNSTFCFSGLGNESGLSNYSSIPTSWKE